MDTHSTRGEVRPLRRTEGLLVREVDSETIVYEVDSGLVTALRPRTAEVWRCCNGTMSVSEICRSIAAPEDEVATTLARLDGAGFLSRSARAG